MDRSRAPDGGRIETYSHAFFTWALGKHGVKVGQAAAIAGAIGAVLPDVPALVGTAFNVGQIFLREEWGSIDFETLLDSIPASDITGVALHSAIVPLALLLLYFVLKIGRRDHRGMFLWFLIGWLGHTVADFLTHAENARPLFWPISGWMWNSPISYYDPLHFGREFFLISHVLILLMMAALLVRWILRRGKGAGTSSGENP